MSGIFILASSELYIEYIYCNIDFRVSQLTATADTIVHNSHELFTKHCEQSGTVLFVGLIF